MNAASPPLLLTERQIPLGALVWIWNQEKGAPLTHDPDGTPLPPLHCLVGGVPMRRKLYPDDLQSIPEHRDPVSGQRSAAHATRSSGLEGFKPEVRFTPVHVFRSSKAPEGIEYAVFTDSGEPLRYQDLPDFEQRSNKSFGWYDQPVSVVLTGGQFISRNGYAYGYYNRPVELPEGAWLVPTAKIEGLDEGD